MTRESASRDMRENTPLFSFFFFYQYCHRVFIFVRNCSPVRINSSRPKRSATITLGKCTGRFYNLWFPNDRLVFCTAVLTLVSQLLLHRPALFTFVARLKYWYFSSLYIYIYILYIYIYTIYCLFIVFVWNDLLFFCSSTPMDRGFLRTRIFNLGI